MKLYIEVCSLITLGLFSLECACVNCSNYARFKAGHHELRLRTAFLSLIDFAFRSFGKNFSTYPRTIA